MRVRIRGVRNGKCGNEARARSPGREELESLQSVEHLTTTAAGDCDFNVLVLAPDRAEEEVDRAAGGDVPRDIDVPETAGHLLGIPWIPHRQVGLEDIHVVPMSLPPGLSPIADG
jgi:hypothetical protein